MSARREAKTLTRLAVPVIITQVNVMAMGVVDTIMVGHLGVDALGAASLGRVWLFGTLLMTMGTLMGVDPLVSQAHGAQDRTGLGTSLQRGLVLAWFLSPLLAVIWLLTRPALELFGQDPGLSHMAEIYVRVQIPSIPFFLSYSVMRSYLQGRAIVRPAMWVAIFGNVLNVGLNWVLIYGHLGVPALGLMGAGIATALVRFLMCLALSGSIVWFRLHEGGWVPWSRAALQRSGLTEILNYGLPVGVHMGLEVWAFEIATLLAGRLGNDALGAHVIALNLASFAFMFPLGVSIAAATRVGNLIGAGKSREAQTSAWVAFGLGAGIMLVSAATFVIFRGVLPRIYTDSAAVIALAASILPIAAAFQVFDGTQVVGSGILRGMGQTRPAAMFNLIGYYALALPLAWWLAFHRGLGLPGIWWGMAAGLGVIAGLLVWWIRRRGPAFAVSLIASEAAPAPPEGP